MAPFTSVTSGTWGASATWGKAGDPPVAGTDYPGVNGDTWNVAAGHTVTFDKDLSALTTGLGAGTIAATGTLKFSTTTGTYYLK